ncbi:MAG: hypothetical protein JRI34_04905 [Deltaproteobacteria bacterium]|nr:hypothetical protein [Deltaproteobacteria bacterium]
MANGQERIEVERVVNLVSGFGWSKEKEEVSETDIKIVLSKKRKAATPEGKAD